MVVCAEGEGSGERMAEAFREEGLVVDRSTELTQPGTHMVVQPLERGFVLPSLKLAVLAERMARRGRPPPVEDDQLLAMSRAAARTRALVLCQSAPPSLCRLGVSPPL